LTNGYPNNNNNNNNKVKSKPLELFELAGKNGVDDFCQTCTPLKDDPWLCMIVAIVFIPGNLQTICANFSFWPKTEILEILE
jgi:hypothetical protein